MDSVKIALTQLDESIKKFKDEYTLHKSSNKVTDEWQVRDVLSHITFWHEYYAKNLSSEARGEKYLFPKIKYQILNQQGVGSLKIFPEEELFKRLLRANKQIEVSILKDKVTEMTYREGSKPYKILDFLIMINRHIQSHTRAVKKTKKI